MSKFVHVVSMTDADEGEDLGVVVFSTRELADSFVHSCMDHDVSCAVGQYAVHDELVRFVDLVPVTCPGCGERASDHEPSDYDADGLCLRYLP